MLFKSTGLDVGRQLLIAFFKKLTCKTKWPRRQETI